MFEADFNSDDSEDDADYIPTPAELEEDDKNQKELLSSVITTDQPEVTVSNNKSHEESVWKNFLSEVKSTTCYKGKNYEIDVSKNVDLMKNKSTTISDASSVLDKTTSITSSSNKRAEESSDEMKLPSSDKCTDILNIPSFDKFIKAASTSDNSNSQINSEKLLCNTMSLNHEDQKSNTSFVTIVPNKKRSNLNSLVGSINKKPKMSTLQKSLKDWNSFKQEEGLEESLKQYNKGKGGYIERQAFLLKSDVASFEIEKNLRLNKK